MFYQVQYLPRGSEVWIHAREIHLILESAIEECNGLRIECPQWRYRIIKCEVLDD